MSSSAIRSITSCLRTQEPSALSGSPLALRKLNTYAFPYKGLYFKQGIHVRICVTTNKQTTIEGKNFAKGILILADYWNLYCCSHWPHSALSKDNYLCKVIYFCLFVFDLMPLSAKNFSRWDPSGSSVLYDCVIGMHFTSRGGATMRKNPLQMDGIKNKDLKGGLAWANTLTMWRRRDSLALATDHSSLHDESVPQTWSFSVSSLENLIPWAVRKGWCTRVFNKCLLI